MTKLCLPYRPDKPRHSGITACMDIGVPLATQQHILESYAGLLDLAKLGTAAAYVNPVLQQKIDLYQQFGIPVCCGGTLFEKFYQQNQLMAYRQFLLDHNIHWVEISSGVLDIPQAHLLEIVQEWQDDFIVVAEVGKKFCHTHPQQWLQDIQQFLAVGARYVILEGRGTADAGIYTSQGMLEHSLIEQITQQLDCQRLLFEAPTSAAQIQLIQTLGSNVNLANINMHELMELEALRLGLRADTFTIC